MTAFSSAARIEGVHPLQCGIVRRKIRTSRRHGMPIVNPLIFYPVRAVEFVSVVAQWLTVGWRYHSIKKRVLADPAQKVLRRRRNPARRHRGHGERRTRRRLRRQDPGHLRRAEKGITPSLRDGRRVHSPLSRRRNRSELRWKIELCANLFTGSRIPAIGLSRAVCPASLETPSEGKTRGASLTFATSASTLRKFFLYFLRTTH